MKLLIDAGTLQTMFAKNPEIEVELVKNGAAQVAARLHNRIMETTTGEAFLQNIITQINAALNYKYHMPESVTKVIVTVVRENIQKYNAEEAESLARKYFDEAFAKHSRTLEGKIESMATSLIEKKIAAVFAQAARLK